MAPRKYATLVSVDGMEFVVPLEACYASPMLAAGVGKNARFGEAGTQRIKLETIRSVQSFTFPPGLIDAQSWLPCASAASSLPVVDDEKKLSLRSFRQSPSIKHEVALHERHLHLT